VASVRVLLVDDSPEFVRSAIRLLSADPRLEILGVATTGGDAVTHAARTRPDVVLMDLRLPGIDGLEATRRIKRLPDAPKVVITTLHDNAEYHAAAAAVGADGFVPKTAFAQHLLPLLDGFVALANAKSEVCSGSPPGYDRARDGSP
jgi:DNA-binding NarL/FixJ family response regulator